ncbi:MAG: N-acetylmuramoyl-L-alanine amidase [Verrucomicrobiaceae bacterium]|nr:MAG: N-acetylmuramoyl-L-alanine amidase [Verrucomicrobiaceae bacterium]
MSDRKKITIDAGHGGDDSGAVGPTGKREKDVALSVALLLGGILATDFNVDYTRKTDVFIPLERRATMCNDSRSDAFISIHCNSGPPGRGEGFEVFTTPGETASDKFATDLFVAFGAEFPLALKRLDMTDGDPDKEASFVVIRKTHCRAALFELEFIHTAQGENLLTNPQFQARAAKALAAGIRKHFGIQASSANAPDVDLHTRIRQTTALLQSQVAQLSATAAA